MSKSKLVIYSDYIWPYCYIGMGIVDKLSEEFDLDIKWHSFEIHPETPPEGVDLEKRFGIEMLGNSLINLKSRGKNLNLKFGELKYMPNSNLAHQLSLYAKDMGVFDSIHSKLMTAYFKDLKDIGSLEVLIDISRSVGLDSMETYKILSKNTYKKEVDRLSSVAINDGITSTPTFIINDTKVFSGAQPLDYFRNILKDLK